MKNHVFSANKPFGTPQHPFLSNIGAAVAAVVLSLTIISYSLAIPLGVGSASPDQATVLETHRLQA